MTVLLSLAAGLAAWAAESAGRMTMLGGRLDELSGPPGAFLVGLCSGAAIAAALHMFWVRPIVAAIRQRALRFVRTTQIGTYGDIQSAKYEIRRLIRWFFRGAAALQVGLVLAASILTLSQWSELGGGSIASAAFGASCFSQLVPILRGLSRIPVPPRSLVLVGLGALLISGTLGILSPVLDLPYGLGFGAGSLTLFAGLARILYKATESAELGILAPWSNTDMR